ncbi:hypothetical protein OIE75_41285 (plasmid) [Streptomyces sp. NBC_01723]|uniref:hypothetical protein n=1 Tax=Streptomyces sp. NBC_01723 TaxID=2975921 RepID=UPI002E365D71|nr:hypothetical protein [Streptomyces sp. NBC_01723]
MPSEEAKTAGRVPTTGHVPAEDEIQQIIKFFQQNIDALKEATDGLPAYFGIQALDTAVAILEGQLWDCRERVDVVGMAVAWGDLTRTARQMSWMPGFQEAWRERPEGTL